MAATDAAAGPNDCMFPYSGGSEIITVVGAVTAAGDSFV